MSDNDGNKIKKYTLEEIPEDSFFTRTAYLDKHFVLAAPEMPFNANLINSLKSWGFNEVSSTGEVLDKYAPDTSGEESMEEIIFGDNEYTIRAEKFYASFQRYTEDLFLQITIKKELNYSAVLEKVREACDIIREDMRYLLRAKKPSAKANYLASHAVKSMIISIIIGSYLKLPKHRLIELGIAALLHEVGMLKLSSRIYMATRPLNSEERKSILTHPIIGFNILKSFSFPLTICLAALEHHERENGEGYPQRITGEKISLYGKIIAVACSYEALSSQRPHKEAKDGYTGMLELLKNEGKQYDDTIVRALIFSISMYPIGLYVLLSSGKKGQVVDVNPENPRFPIVQVFGELTPDGKNKIIETSQEGISITRPLSREEIGTS